MTDTKPCLPHRINPLGCETAGSNQDAEGVTRRGGEHIGRLTLVLAAVEQDSGSERLRPDALSLQLVRVGKL